MVTFRNNNNNRRPPFRNNNRRPPFRRNDEGSSFSNNNFQRKIPGRNNHNASKLIEKYNDLAREALSNEDKILSENYFQHADHFTRVQKEQENNRITKANEATTEVITPIKSGEEKDISKSSDDKKDLKLSEKQLATS
mgnify:FL=1